MPDPVSLFVLPVLGGEGAPLRAAEIDPCFEGYVRSNPLLVNGPGVKIIHLDDGNQVILAVASTVLKDDSAAERLRAEQVCRIKALASIVAEKQGVQVAHVEQANEKMAVVIENGKETGRSLTEVLQVTIVQVRGVAKEIQVVGRWQSADGKVFFLALCTMYCWPGKLVPERKAAKEK
jgi:hypothetical protein